MKHNKFFLMLLAFIVLLLTACVATKSPFMVAANNGNKEEMLSLVSAGADVNEQDKDGYSPLMMAAGNGHVELVEFLINQGADVNAVGAARQTPLMLAAMEGENEVIKILLKNGADIHHTDLFGRSILMLAIIRGKKDSVNLLLQNKANINVKDNYGRTPFFIASQTPHADVRNLLEQNENLIINTLPMSLNEFHMKWNNQQEFPMPFEKFEHNGVFAEVRLTPSTVLMAGETSGKLYWASVALLSNINFTKESFIEFMMGALNLVSVTNPDLTPDERINIFEELKFFGENTDNSQYMNSITVKNITYSIEVATREGAFLNFSAYKSKN